MLICIVDMVKVLHLSYVRDLFCILFVLRTCCHFVPDSSAFHSDFASGFLLGELLFKFGLQDDFDQFSQNKYVIPDILNT